MKKRLIAYLVLTSLILAGCGLYRNDKTIVDKAKTTVAIAVALPVVVPMAVFFVGLPAFVDSYTYDIKEFANDNPCLKPYKATRSDVDDFVFVVSDPISCSSASNSQITFTENKIYYLKADPEKNDLSPGRDNSVELNTITGMTYTCTTPPNKNAKTMACAPLDRFEISKSGYLGGASLSFVKPDGKGDLSYEWPIFFKYNRSCEKPIFSAKIRPGEDFLVGLSSAEYRGNTLARACNLRLIRKIPRSSLQ